MAGLQQGRRRHRVAEVVVQEVAQAARSLELGHVTLHVEAVDTPHLERNMLTDNRVDVGHHQNLLAEIPVLVLLTEDTGPVIGAQHQTAAQPPTNQSSPEADGASSATFTTRSREHRSFSAV